MKAQDLRVGNLIKYTNAIDLRSDLRRIIISVDSSVIGFIESVDRPDFYEPIPLSPSVLEAAGFKKLNNAWNIDMNRDDTFFSLFDHNYCSGELNLKYNVANGPTPKVKYLHQLQNIYFALTGTELTIDINKLK